MSADTGAPARTLADQLRGWPDDRLSRLLALRPDLATPAPVDSGQLASRAATRSSLHRALDLLTTTELFVLDALVIAGQTTVAELAAIVHADPPKVAEAAARLVDLALAWEGPGGLRPLSGVADGLGPHRSGLHPCSPDASAAEEVQARIASLSPAARALLDHVESHGGEGTTGAARRSVTPDDARTPVEELLAHRLLLPREGGVLRLPGEVGLALRGGRTTRDPVDVVPEPATSERDPALLARTAAGAAFEAVRRTEMLLDHWSLDPPAALRSGGLGVRDLKAATALLQVDDPTAALVVEVAAAAGLLATGQLPDGTAAWLPTDAYDAWATRPVAERWERLATTWLHSDRTPGRVGTRDAQGKAANPLIPELVSPRVAEARRAVLTELAALPDGAVLATGTGLPSLIARLEHLRPRRAWAEPTLWTIAEAAALGWTGLGGLAPHARLLLQGEADRAVATVAPLLPAPVDHVLIQADLTAVAPGPLETELARRLGLVADLESHGGAGVYRFSAASVRRALDVGWSATEIHDFLGSISRTPLPQPLTYLVDDTVRTFGALRVGAAEAFVRSDDEAALTELMHHPRASAWGLRRIAPTVVISTVPIDLLLPRLREIGAAPVVEAPDGTVRVARPDLLRARSRRPRTATGLAAAKQSAHVAGVVAAIRAGDRASAARPASPASAATTPSSALALLREAIEAAAPVWIGYVDNHGSNSERVVEPRRVEGGRLTAFDHRSEEVREFAVHRITAVRAVEER